MTTAWQARLLRWYQENKRDLPWRRSRDPYAVWVSEIMLQQTTVEAVIPYYERFLKKFPDVRSLGKADEEEVLTLWSGLGYYSRARNLHKAARQILSSSPVAVPDTVEGLLELPGICRYTAGAIASIAFEKRAPILDGNVMRVLSRHFLMAEDPKSTTGQKVFWKKAEDILPLQAERISYGDFNQALMELGARVCSPERPSCLQCPILSSCGAHREGRAGEFPKILKKTEYVDVEMSAALIVHENKDKLLMVQRPKKGFLQGMWEFPMVEGSLDNLLKEWAIGSPRTLSAVKHSVLNKRLRIQIYWNHASENAFFGSGKTMRWVSLNEFDELPMSSMNRKILKQLERVFLPITKVWHVSSKTSEFGSESLALFPTSNGTVKKK